MDNIVISLGKVSLLILVNASQVALLLYASGTRRLLVPMSCPNAVVCVVVLCCVVWRCPRVRPSRMQWASRLALWQQLAESCGLTTLQQGVQQVWQLLLLCLLCRCCFRLGESGCTSHTPSRTEALHEIFAQSKDAFYSVKFQFIIFL